MSLHCMQMLYLCVGLEQKKYIATILTGITIVPIFLLFNVCVKNYFTSYFAYDLGVLRHSVFQALPKLG